MSAVPPTMPAQELGPSWVERAGQFETYQFVE